MATERIVIVVSSDGTETVIRNIAGVGNQAKTSADSVNFLKTALAGLATGEVLKSAADLLDTYQNMQNRLKVVTKSQDELKYATQALMDVANRSRGSFEDSTELFTRMALSSDQLGFSHQQLLRVTETLNKAVVLSGASSREASFAMIQLAQGIASGALRGQEMRSVLTQIPFVADLISQKLGVTRGALRTLGAEGRVTAQVMIQALLEASNKVDDLFTRVSPTIGQQINILKNQVLAFVGALNEKFNIIPRVTAMIDFLGSHVEAVGRIAFAGVLVLGVLKAVDAINLLTLVLTTNPFGLIAVAIVAGVAALVAFADKITLSTNDIATLSDFAQAVWEEMIKDFRFVADAFEKNFGFIGDFFKQVFGSDFEFSIKGMLTVFAHGIDGMSALVRGLIEAIKTAFNNLPAVIELIWKGMLNTIIAATEAEINLMILAFNQLATTALGKRLGIGQMALVDLGRVELSDEAKKHGADIGAAFMSGFQEVMDDHPALSFLDKMFVRANQIAQARIKQSQDEAASRLQQMGIGQSQADTLGTPNPNLKSQRDLALDEVTRKIQEQSKALQEYGIQEKVMNDYRRIDNELRSKGITLSDQEAQGIQQQLRNNELLKERAGIMNQIVGADEESTRKQQILNELIQQGGQYTQQYASALRQLQIAQLMANRDAVSGFKAGFLQVQEDMSNFAAASSKVVTNAFQGMEDAMVDFVHTGKLNFSSLVDGILSDMTRLLFRMAMSNFFSSLAGTGGGLGGIFGSLAKGFGGGLAEGGPVEPGKTYLVGERGPELFRSGAGGSIVPNHAMGGGPTNVHVSVVNVTDPNEVPRIMGDQKNDHVVLNTLRRNPRAAKQALGIS